VQASTAGRSATVIEGVEDARFWLHAPMSRSYVHVKRIKLSKLKNMICFMHIEIKEADQQNCNTFVQASTAGRSATVTEDARFRLHATMSIIYVHVIKKCKKLSYWRFRPTDHSGRIPIWTSSLVSHKGWELVYMIIVFYMEP
jgi:hypothetical protein